MPRKLQNMNINRRRIGGSFLSSGEEFSSIVANEKRNEPSADIKLSSDEPSLNSSYADLFEASGVVIHDYEGSFSRDKLPANAVTYNLSKCKSKVVVPYYHLLCLIGWRPFMSVRCRLQCLLKLCNFIYIPLFICILFFWYIIRVYTCQGKFSIDEKELLPTENVTTMAPHTTTTISPNVTTFNWTKMFEATRHNKSNISMVKLIPLLTRCNHVFGTYIVPGFLHFIAYFIGIYHFRIQDHEGLYVLMEKVYLQSSIPNRITRHLRAYLLGGFLWWLYAAGVSVAYLFVFGPEEATGISKKREGIRLLITMATGIVISGMFARCVHLAVVLSYCGQCQLLKYYIEGVAEKLEEKTIELKSAMKDILEIKRHFNRLNGLLSLSMSCIVFDLIIVVAITTVLLFNYNVKEEVWWYRAAVLVQWGSLLTFVLVQAALLTSSSRKLIENALTIRVFGYQSYTQFDIDSFLNFLNMVKLEAQIFTIPVKPRYLWGLLIFSVQILILMFQTGKLAPPKNKWL